MATVVRIIGGSVVERCQFSPGRIRRPPSSADVLEQVQHHLARAIPATVQERLEKIQREGRVSVQEPLALAVTAALAELRRTEAVEPEDAGAKLALGESVAIEQDFFPVERVLRVVP